MQEKDCNLFHVLAACLVMANVKTIIEKAKIEIPGHTFDPVCMGRTKPKRPQLKALVIIALVLEDFEPPLSIATKLSSPAKIIVIPPPPNQIESVFM